MVLEEDEAVGWDKRIWAVLGVPGDPSRTRHKLPVLPFR